MWKKAKAALGLNLCAFQTKTRDEEFPLSEEGRRSEASAAPEGSSMASSGGGSVSAYSPLKPSTFTLTSTILRLSKSRSRSFKKTCAICLGNMKAGHGAIFTAECSHSFHFNCIASSVKHGNCMCPICRAKWKEIPFQGLPCSQFPRGNDRVNPMSLLQEDGTITLLRRLPYADSSHRQNHVSSLSNISEPNNFDDDEALEFIPEETQDFGLRSTRAIDIKAYPEFSTIAKTAFEEKFTVLIHLKVPSAVENPISHENQNASLTISHSSRVPVDLVTVLDISGSMAGTKLALLKQAMSFVIQNLGPSDRLSVISFSSTARRLFPLCRMSESGRQHALQAVNSLLSSGGTNIAEGLRKGAKVIEDRKEKNPVCSIILLSDGQDTYTVSCTGIGVNHSVPDYHSLVPSSIRGTNHHKIPVHAFGFGADHDSNSMHSISETSGGTFSFIETESVIQDAFAQCIGGLLTVVVQELQVGVECVHPGVKLAPIRSGAYASHVVDGMKGSIRVGDLYADEERDFLISVNVPRVTADEEEIVLLKVGCSYRDPLSKEQVTMAGQYVRIQRPEVVVERSLSIEVDRQRNRVRAAEAMTKAREAAEQGALSEAVSILESHRIIILESLAGRLSDPLSVSLVVELREMQKRMESGRRYEESGRAYVLSGLSSHSWQRATARGDSTNSTSLVYAYKTPSMVDMLQRSQTLCPTPRHPRPAILPTRSFPSQPDPR